jgi:hypothetical protein
LTVNRAFAVAFYVAVPAIVATVRKPQPKLARNHIGADRFCRLWAWRGAEGAMNHGIYTVVKEANEWTISAGGIRIIACRDRRTAIKTVRRAAELLRTDGMAHRGPPTPEARPLESTIRDFHAPCATDPAGYDLPGTAAVAIPV